MLALELHGSRNVSFSLFLRSATGLRGHRWLIILSAFVHACARLPRRAKETEWADARGIKEGRIYGSQGHHVVSSDSSHRPLSWEADRGPHEKIPATEELRRAERGPVEPIAAQADRSLIVVAALGLTDAGAKGTYRAIRPTLQKTEMKGPRELAMSALENERV